jgi:hypothetical protein
MYDNDFDKVAYTYSKGDAIVEVENGTYADKDAPIVTEMVTWNHGLAEVIGSLLGAGLQLQSFNEFNYSPYNCFSHTIEFEPGKFRIEKFGDKIPMVYSILAIKP